jgi:hypothetical protein
VPLGATSDANVQASEGTNGGTLFLLSRLLKNPKS